jgi:hypothetical protein
MEAVRVTRLLAPEVNEGFWFEATVVLVEVPTAEVMEMLHGDELAFAPMVPEVVPSPESSVFHTNSFQVPLAVAEAMPKNFDPPPVLKVAEPLGEV